MCEFLFFFAHCLRLYESETNIDHYNYIPGFLPNQRRMFTTFVLFSDEINNCTNALDY